MAQRRFDRTRVKIAYGIREKITPTFDAVECDWKCIIRVWEEIRYTSQLKPQQIFFINPPQYQLIKKTKHGKSMNSYCWILLSIFPLKFRTFLHTFCSFLVKVMPISVPFVYQNIKLVYTHFERNRNFYQSLCNCIAFLIAFYFLYFSSANASVSTLARPESRSVMRAGNCTALSTGFSLMDRCPVIKL